MLLYVENPDLVVVTKDEYFKKYQMIDSIKENGILLINTTDEEVLKKKYVSRIRRL